MSAAVPQDGTGATEPAWPVVYINLAEDTERDRRMQREFARSGLAARRLDASRWSREPVEVQQKHYSDALNRRCYFRPLLPGERGCYLSHLRAWQELLASEAQALVVLEDDVVLKPQLRQVLESLAQAPQDWDLVKLIGRGREKVGRRTVLPGGVALVDYRRVPSLTAGYVLSRSGAAKLVASRIPFARPIDVDLRHWWENGLRVRGVQPDAIGLAETSFDSSIGDKKHGADLRRQWNKFVFKLRYSMLNAWHRWTR